jgi:hypothetical protein
LSGLRMWFVARNKRGGWLSLRWFRTTNSSTRTKSWMGGLPLSSSWLGSSLAHLLLRDRVHLPNVLVHSFACIIAPSTWCFRFESLPRSLASHASMIFLQNKALAAPHARPLHVVW